MRLSNKSSVIEERQRDWVAHQKQCYRISQSEVNIWFINCRINCYISTSTLYCDLYIDWSPFYSSARHISSIIARAFLSIYLICSTFFFRLCTSTSSLQFEKDSENIRVCKSNRRVLFVSVQKLPSIRSSWISQSSYSFVLSSKQNLLRLRNFHTKRN